MQFFIVLVEPARTENVGAAARAMKTMGFHSLRIVDSQAHLEPGARRVAHGAGDILDNVTCYPTLADALADVDFTVATTARSRARFHYYCTPTELLGVMQEKQQWVSSAALVFGREDSGLTNDELALADISTGVPMQADYPSLNLGQAVMVYCYQLAKLMQVQAETAQAGQLVALRHRLEKLLVTLQVDYDEKLRDRLLQRIGLLQQRDTAMLHTLLHDIEKALK
ncbi:tRNA/rRNA methyltransferase [Candidatus Symbiopectobacterium sp.]|uniref:tRNA/rRNA methyltransferase n=1 Tax=Candidatus Symbiopectobacterium sp. TaxID=2816440 RepID=UPI0025C06257|nr:tRNA/rRNA methyltransferase [Candidatus Symbiopectobacterium sp.]